MDFCIFLNGFPLPFVELLEKSNPLVGSHNRGVHPWSLILLKVIALRLTQIRTSSSLSSARSSARSSSISSLANPLHAQLSVHRGSEVNVLTPDLWLVLQNLMSIQPGGVDLLLSVGFTPAAQDGVMTPPTLKLFLVDA
ncbi:unnamed protein product [Microthlaspi erraticum]|uniref:Uncharacterized protein n=1 Tax=Microthlaspi erraticum TaxID=1685480 RepID=A0A6D2I1M7_9BRAS|nr:unnamed protein product [Microthlaspi erraticum]